MFKVKEHVSARLDLWVILYETLEEFRDDSFIHVPEPLMYKGRKYWFKIIAVNRLDKYAGECEDITRELAFNPELCICRSELEKVKLSLGFY